MSAAFPTRKDELIDDLEAKHALGLSEEEYGRLRRLTEAELLLVGVLLARARREALLGG